MPLHEAFDPVVGLIAEHVYPYRGHDPVLRERHYRVIRAALKVHPEILADDIASVLHAHLGPPPLHPAAVEDSANGNPGKKAAQK